LLSTRKVILNLNKQCHPERSARICFFYFKLDANLWSNPPVQLHTMTHPRTSLAPWLTVPDGEKAVAFYKSAFAATEAYRLDMPPEAGTVVRLSINDAEFWVSSEAAAEPQSTPQPVGGDSIRMILTVADPDDVFAQALSAGATQVFPVGEEHGWRLGRLIDPFGLHWEIGRPIVE
jgi:PhnB protein